ncbi:MAG: response regulator [Actinomycetota bacterium]|nr:response regulator [Actinomycetota bacterium]
MSRILAVEDSGAIRLLLTRRLKLAGHAVETAADGIQAIRKLEDTVPEDRPELILLDLTMPQLDGAGTLPSIRRLAPGVPVILVSAQPDLDRIETSVNVEASVPKPIDFDLLNRLIAELTSGA